MTKKLSDAILHGLDMVEESHTVYLKFAVKPPWLDEKVFMLEKPFACALGMGAMALSISARFKDEIAHKHTDMGPDDIYKYLLKHVPSAKVMVQCPACTIGSKGSVCVLTIVDHLHSTHHWPASTVVTWLQAQGL